VTIQVEIDRKELSGKLREAVIRLVDVDQRLDSLQMSNAARTEIHYSELESLKQQKEILEGEHQQAQKALIEFDAKNRPPSPN
jgi:hypothetical protein